jgi:GT2 family glycosyltransferase
MNVLFVPTLGLDLSLLERLATSVDYPIRSKVAFNNGEPGALDWFRYTHPDWIVKESAFGNLGVAGSWNFCAKMFPEEPCWILMNDDAWFLPGYLEKIVKVANEYEKEPIIYLNNSNAYYCFVWTARGKRNVGDFDDNFWPAYYEDCDYRVRLNSLGYNGFVYALQGLEPLPHGKPKTGGINYKAMLDGCGLLNRQYWYYKWGNQNFEEATYQTPYKDHRLRVDQWAWYPEQRAIRKQIWDSWMLLPNPSIYD